MKSRFPLVAPFLLAPLAALSHATDTARDGPAARTPLFERVAVIGASVSDGFGLEGELEARAHLGHFIEAALRAPRDSVQALASGMFFLDPLGSGARQVQEAVELEATLAIGVDFLFWYGYGGVASEDARLERFEQGLALLERLSCPIVVGDLPDMTPALKGSSPLMGGGPMLHARQIPAPETLARLNARLAEWAAAREDVVVLPLVAFLDALREGAEFRAGRHTIAAGVGGALLQSDLLHPKVEGTALIALLALESLREARADVPEEAIAASARPIVAAVLERTEEEREKRRERERAREERRRAREERRGGGEREEGLALEAA